MPHNKTEQRLHKLTTSTLKRQMAWFRVCPLAVYFLTTSLGACGGGDNTLSHEQVVLRGNISDGPVIGATITVTDNKGELLALSTSDDTANYTVSIPGNAAFPVIMTATGGTDVVTGRTVDFSMVSVAENAGVSTANINMFSTLIVKTAQAMPGGLTTSTLNIAKQIVTQHLNFGINTQLISDPIESPVTNNNVANYVKANEVFAETIRRTHEALRLTTSLNKDQLIKALAADMTDGQLNGIGTKNTNPYFSAMTSIVSGQVLIEALNNNIHVDGTWAADLLDNAILITMPSATGTTADVRATAEMLAQTKRAINTAQAIAPSQALALSVIDIDVRLPADKVNNLERAMASLALLTSNEQSSINNRIRGSGVTPSNDDVPLSLSWAPNNDMVSGYILYHGNTPETVHNLAYVTPNTSVQLMSKSDIGLSSGDKACFRLKAYNSHSLSHFSDAVCGTI